jgi:hypothetical protein
MEKEFINIKKLYDNDLIKLGSQSNIFKKLPKNYDDLSMCEFLFLVDYVNKALENFKTTLK